MTFQEFQHKVNSSSRIDKIWNYTICLAITMFALAFLSYYIAQPAIFKDIRIFSLIAIFFFLILGLIGLKILPNRYKLISIESNRKVEDKKKIIEEVLEYFGSSKYLVNENTAFFQYSKGLFRSSFEVQLYFDSTKICFSVRGSTGGFIDLGGTEKIRQQFRDEIELKLAYT